MTEHFRARLRAAYVRGMATLSDVSHRMTWDQFADLHHALEMLREADEPDIDRE